MTGKTRFQPEVGKKKQKSTTALLFSPYCNDIIDAVATKKFNRQVYHMSLGNKIAYYRKQLNITQEGLAKQLEVTNQAVSKWESDQCCPDILLLPRLADIFGISLDELFDRRTQTADLELPWNDDGVLRAVLFFGHKYIKDSDEKGIEFTYDGPALNVSSSLTVHCGDVQGNVQAGGSITCEDVAGNISAGGSVTCCNVTGDIRAGGKLTCCDVEGSVSAGGSIACCDISGDVHAGRDIECGNISGNATAEVDISCGDVGGNASAGGDINCGDIGGSITSG